MKSKLLYSISLLFLVQFTSCMKPCNCEPVLSMFIDVKIVNQQGQNLLLGPSPIYNRDSIQVLSQKNNLSTKTASVRINSDSTLAFYFYNPVVKSYIYYNQQSSSDSLEIKWRPKNGECCGEKYTTYEVDLVKINTVLATPVNGSYLLIK